LAQGYVCKYACGCVIKGDTAISLIKGDTAISFNKFPKLEVYAEWNFYIGSFHFNEIPF